MLTNDDQLTNGAEEGSMQSDAKEQKREAYEEEMSSIIGDLLDQNVELTKQFEELKQETAKKNEQELAALHEYNEKLTKKKWELEASYYALTEELDRIEEINEELEKENERLTEESEDLKRIKKQRGEEHQSVYDEIAAQNLKISEERQRKGNDSSAEENVEQMDKLKQHIEIVMRMNEQLVQLLDDSNNSSSEDEFEIVNNVNE